MTRKPPARAKTNTAHVTARNKVQERLLSDYALFQDWRKVGAQNGVSGGMAYRVATSDYEPRNNTIRAAIGLPVLKAAPVCPKCNVVHARQCRVVPAWVEAAVDFLRARARKA